MGTVVASAIPDELLIEAAADAELEAEAEAWDAVLPEPVKVYRGRPVLLAVLRLANADEKAAVSLDRMANKELAASPVIH